MAVWAIDGAEAPASLARILTDAAMKSEAGILSATDYRVTELPTPGGFVRVHPGAASIRNSYQLESRQHYIVEDPGAVDVPVTPTGSSPAGGVNRVVIKTLRDPQYPGVADPGGDYDLFDVVDVGPDLDTYEHPFEKLYEFHQPANTATITQDMITRDWRRVANPKEATVTVGRSSLTGDDGLVLNSSRVEGNGGEWWPNDGGNWYIPVPDWATRVMCKSNRYGVEIDANVNPYGAQWVEFGPGIGGFQGTQDRERKMQELGFNSSKTSDIKRDPQWGYFGESYIPAHLRGEDVLFVMKARYRGPDDGVHMDAYSATEMTLVFQQIPDNFESPSL